MSRIVWIAIAFLAMCGCKPRELSDPDYFLKTARTTQGTVRLTTDNPKVRELIADQAKRRSVFPPDKAAFLEAMRLEPGIDVPSGSSARLLETSDALCGREVEGATEERVRITTGPKTGVEGWACFRTELWPSYP